MTFFFPPLIRKNEIISHIDNLLIQVDTKIQMFDRFRIFHETLRKSKLKVAPDKTYFFLATRNFLGYVITKNNIRPLLDKFGAIQLTKPSEAKKIVMKLLGVPKHYSKNTSFYTLSHVDVFYQWNKEREADFLQVKQRLTQLCEMTIFLLWLMLLLWE